MSLWKTGDSGERVREAIEREFDRLNKRIDQGTPPKVMDFKLSDWDGGTIFIAQSEYNKAYPCVDLYMKLNGVYSLVLGGYSYNSGGIELQSDIPYEGRVVIR